MNSITKFFVASFFTSALLTPVGATSLNTKMFDAVRALDKMDICNAEQDALARCLINSGSKNTEAEACEDCFVNLNSIHYLYNTMSTTADCRLQTDEPSKSPSSAPSRVPTKRPTKQPVHQPFQNPTNVPTKRPTKQPTHQHLD